MRKEDISLRLLTLCSDNGVQCLYAIESGSRAWGFASPDSDYDIRFIYIRAETEYLKINRPRDVIEHMSADNLDMVGWDVMKALTLLQKSNPSIIEWLNTNDTYYVNHGAYSILHALSLECFDAFTLSRHYLALADKHRTKYIEGKNEIAPKKYLYTLRAILNAQYVLKHNTIPPILFQELLESSGLSSDMLAFTTKLLDLKSQTQEKQKIHRITQLDTFIDHMFYELTESNVVTRKDKVNDEVINQVFLRLLQAQDIPHQ